MGGFSLQTDGELSSQSMTNVYVLSDEFTVIIIPIWQQRRNLYFCGRICVH